MKKNYFFSLIAMLFICLSANAASELTFSNVSLAPGSKLEALVADQEITFNTNMDAEIGYMYAEIKDEATGEIVGTRTTVYDPDFNNTGDEGDFSNLPQTKKDPHFTFVCPSYTKMYEEHTYSLILTAYASKNDSYGAGNILATGTIQYEGASASYIPSPFKLISITPDPSTFIIKSNDNRSVTLHFNSKVRLDEAGSFINTGFGSSAAYESMVPGEDADTVTTKRGNFSSTYVYSSEWTLTPKAGTISDGVDVIFVANAFDKSDLHVTATAAGLEKYSTGNDETSCYTFTIMNDLNKDTFTITPDSKDNNKTLSTFVVSSEEGIAVANIKDPAVLYKVEENGTKTEVAQVKWNIELGNTQDYDEVAKELRLVLDQPVTKAGNYILSFPRNYFNFGSGMLATSSGATDIEYTIAKDATEYNLTFTPDGEVPSISSVLISYDKEYEVGYNMDLNECPVYFFNESKEIVTKGHLDYPDDFNDFQSVKVVLDEAITTPGKYTMIVPDGEISIEEGAGMMSLRKAARGGMNFEDDDYDDEEEDYTFNAAIIKEFTVVAGSTENVTLEISLKEGAKVASVEKIDFTFNGATTVTAGSGMGWWKTSSIKNGNKVSVVSVDGNVATVRPSNDMSTATTLTTEKAADYTLTLPEGYFIVNGNAWPEIVLNFTVDPEVATDIEGTETEKPAAKTVYTLSGAEVNAAAAANGAYIVNGKKVILK